MYIPRIYQSSELKTGAIIELDKIVAHHVRNVLRLKQEDPLILFNGFGGEYHAVITDITKRDIVVKIKSFHAIECESTLKIHLAQGISRGEKMDFTIQKAVELGVTEITPILTSRCGVQLSSARWLKRQQHWQSIIISACEQCGRNKLPTLNKVCDFKDWVNNFKAELKFVLEPQADISFPKIIESTASIGLLVGPEGGFSETEIEVAVKNNFQVIQLGPRILRTETAALAALAVLQFGRK